LILLFFNTIFKIFQNPHSYMVKTAMYRMGKRQVKNESALKEIRIPEEGELFGRVIKMMGGENVMIKCTDGLTRRGRIRGKLKRRVWIRDNDIVIIAPWDFKEDERGDIVWRFTLPQVQWLKDNDHIPRDF
jgi:translation initiation factor 1A